MLKYRTNQIKIMRIDQKNLTKVQRGLAIKKKVADRNIPADFLVKSGLSAAVIKAIMYGAITVTENSIYKLEQHILSRYQ